MTGPIGHPDVEALSAYVDGEAPEWAAHVAGCAACRASADDLRAVAAAVGRPVAPASDEVREAALAAALGAAAGPAAPGPAAAGPPAGAPRAAGAPPPPPRDIRSAPTARPRWWWLTGAAAAAVVLVVGVAALLAAGSHSTAVNRTAVPALEASPTTGFAAGAAAAAPSDLGEVPDAATLAARARPGLSAKSSANSTDVAATPLGAAPLAPNAGAGASGGAASAATPTPTAAIAGTRPCEDQARARQPSLGPVVYFATATRNGAPAVVLGFGTGPGANPPVTLLLLAQNGCAELLRSVGP